MTARGVAEQLPCLFLTGDCRGFAPDIQPLVSNPPLGPETERDPAAPQPKRISWVTIEIRGSKSPAAPARR